MAYNLARSLRRGCFQAAATALVATYLSSSSEATPDADDAATLSEDFLMGEISLSLGSRRGWRHKNAKAAEAFLQPLFEALPKISEGKLGNAAARYLLHRYFAERHGWFLHGLEPARAGWNASAQGRVPRDAASAFVLGTVQDLLTGAVSAEAEDGAGLSVGQLAVVVSTIEHLIEEDVVKKLQAEYAAEGLVGSGTLRSTDRSDPNSLAAVPEELAVQLVARQLLAVDGKKTMPQAPAAAALKSALKGKTTDGSSSSGGAYTFADVRQLLQHGSQQMLESRQSQCSSLRSNLQELAEKHTGGGGLISLGRFYEIIGDVGSVQSLREAGALDDVTHADPNVVVANYLSSSAQCVPLSGYHSVCCQSPCEAILASFEKASSGAAAASPPQVLHVAESLNSSGVSLPESQERLKVLAQRESDGLVRLHSREFSQWLHYAFPLDCPLPVGEDAAAKHPRTADEWMRPYTGGNAFFKQPEQEKAWDVDEEEELLILHAARSINSDEMGGVGHSRFAKLGRAGLMAAAVLSASLGLVRAIRLTLECDITEAGRCGSSSAQGVALLDTDGRERYHV